MMFVLTSFGVCFSSMQSMFENAPSGTLLRRIWKEKMEPTYGEVMGSPEGFGIPKALQDENFVYYMVRVAYGNT